MLDSLAPGSQAWMERERRRALKAPFMVRNAINWRREVLEDPSSRSNQDPDARKQLLAGLKAYQVLAGELGVLA